jgi:hypothetical protein
MLESGKWKSIAYYQCSGTSGGIQMFVCGDAFPSPSFEGKFEGSAFVEVQLWALIASEFEFGRFIEASVATF